MLENLSALGFKEYEAKVFIVLLKGGIMSASEIADKAGIRRTAVYDILKTFAEKGFCNEIETNSILNYEMIDPRIISDKIERDILKEKENTVNHLKNSFTAFENLYRSEMSDKKNIVNVEVIRGFNRHREAKFYELFKQAKQEVLFMIRLEGYISEEIDETAKHFINKGGTIKSIYEASSTFKIKVDDQWVNGTVGDLLKICRSYESYGENIRISTKQLLNITIFDKETVFTNIEDKNIPRHNKSDIVIRNKDYARNMIDLFQYYWDNAFELKEYESISASASKEFL